MLKRTLLMLAAVIVLAFTVGGCQSEWWGGDSFEFPAGDSGDNYFYYGPNDIQSVNNGGFNQSDDFDRSGDHLQHEFNRDVGNPGGVHYDSHGPEY